jgi:hypothetical protein
MRTLLLLALLAAPAQAGTISVTIGGTTRNSAGLLSAPRTAAFDLGPHSNEFPHPILTSWEIPDVMPSDQPRMWTVSEETASGFDWELIENAVVNDRTGYSYRARFIDGSWSGWPELGESVNPGYVMFDLEAIEFHLDYFVSSPAGSAARWHVELVGEGIIVPEPWGLTLFPFLLWCCCPRTGVRNAR